MAKKKHQPTITALEEALTLARNGEIESLIMQYETENDFTGALYGAVPEILLLKFMLNMRLDRYIAEQITKN